MTAVPIDAEAKSLLLAVLTLAEEGSYRDINVLLDAEPPARVAIVASYLAAGWMYDRRCLVNLDHTEPLLEQVQRVGLLHAMEDHG